jgi:hypothetical protein
VEYTWEVDVDFLPLFFPLYEVTPPNIWDLGFV